MTPEERARIARENGAKSKGPVTPEGKEKSARNAITHGQRAEALALMVPPHSSCLVNEERQDFYKLHDSLIAKYRPSGDAERAVVREIADQKWKFQRNNQMESAIFNRELIKHARVMPGTLPEMRQMEISVAAHESLTGNRTIAELRKDSQRCLRAIAHLQRQLKEMQKTWPAAQAPEAEPAPERTQPEEDERTQPDPQNTAQIFEIKGPITPEVANLYREIFRRDHIEFVTTELDAA